MHVIIDTDPGGDDAIALMWLASLCHQGRISLPAVTTAAGNVGAHKTWQNARGLLALCGIENVPVGIGDDVEATRDAAEIHGEDGLGGLACALPESPSPRQSGSCELLTKTLGETTTAPILLAVAPLSNLAQAEALSPGILKLADQIIIMGGALENGNVTPAAEFNFYFDPPAADVVLSASDRIRLVTLETSSTLRLSQEHAKRMTAGFEDLAAARLFTDLCEFMAKREAKFSGHSKATGFPVHDAATVAWLVYPELFQLQKRRLAIDTGNDESRGRLRQMSDPAGAPCDLASGVDASLLLDTMGRDLAILFEHLAKTKSK